MKYYNCKRCEHYLNQDCIWDYMYLNDDIDYAYDCCDWIRFDNNENS